MCQCVHIWGMRAVSISAIPVSRESLLSSLNSAHMFIFLRKCTYQYVCIYVKAVSISDVTVSCESLLSSLDSAHMFIWMRKCKHKICVRVYIYEVSFHLIGYVLARVSSFFSRFGSYIHFNEKIYTQICVRVYIYEGSFHFSGYVFFAFQRLPTRASLFYLL